jgi:hypothetical protein
MVPRSRLDQRQLRRLPTTARGLGLAWYASGHGARCTGLRLAEGLAGAAMTNQFLLEESPWLPLALLVVAAVIAWARRSSSILVDLLRR